MFDHAIADAAFALPQDGVSEVVKGQFGPAIVRVVSITPGSVKTFDEVKDTLKKEIAADRVAGQVQTMHDKIEDARVSGKTLAEAAKSVGLEARAIAAVDAQGRDEKGAALDLPDQAELLAAAYASDVGVDDAPLQTNNRGWLWFDVMKVDPARDRTFDEVKDQVEKQWRAEAVAKALAAKADDMVKQLEGGATLAEPRPRRRARSEVRRRSSPQRRRRARAEPGQRRLHRAGGRRRIGGDAGRPRRLQGDRRRDAADQVRRPRRQDHRRPAHRGAADQRRRAIRQRARKRARREDPPERPAIGGGRLRPAR